MAGKYQTYAEYKYSGVEWLGFIPTGWQMWKLTHVYECIGSGTTPPSDSGEWYDGDIPWVTTGELRESVITSTIKNITLSTVRKFPTLRIYPKNSIAIAMYGATIGRLGIFGVDATTNQACCVLTKSHILNNKYLYYWLQAFRQDIVNLASGGGQPNINQEVVGSLKVSSPNLNEQQKIAEFLDHETAKIDTLIEKQQQLIALLKEKRQAVISHAVTKGLNPNAPMRDSGVEWLGEVPAHWEISKIKYVAELTPKKAEVEKRKDETCNFVPMEKLKTDTLILDEVRLIGEVFDGYTYFKNEDVLMAKVTPCFENKNMVVARGLENGVGFGSSEIYVLRVKINFLNDFLYYRLQEDVFIDLATGAMTGAGGLKRVPSDFLNNFEFALPPENERKDIVDYIRGYTMKIDGLINKAESAIELMQERRTALISAAVTGEIDVRDWQAPESLAQVEQQVSA